MKALRTSLTLLFLLTTFFFTKAQQVGDHISISMKTGSFFKGELLEVDDEKYIIETKDIGTITLYKKDISEIDKLSRGNISKEEEEEEEEEEETETDEKKENKETDKKKKRKKNQKKRLEDIYWHQNPSATHYLYGSTGYSLKKGQIEMQNIWVVFNSLKYGVTDNLTLGVGFEVLNLVFNNIRSIGFGLTAKYAFPIRPEQFNVSANAMYLNYEDTQIGILYGANTVGDRNTNATIGLGFIVSNGDVDTRPLINIAGMARIGHKLSLISESWIMPSNFAPRNEIFVRDDEGFASIVSLGVRHVGKNVVADFSLLVDRKNETTVPWISITIPLNK